MFTRFVCVCSRIRFRPRAAHAIRLLGVRKLCLNSHCDFTFAIAARFAKVAAVETRIRPVSVRGVVEGGTFERVVRGGAEGAIELLRHLVVRRAIDFPR